MLFKGKIFAEIAFVFLLATFAVCNIDNTFIIPLLIAVSSLFLLAVAISGAIKNKIILKHILCILGAIIAAVGYFSVFYNINEKPALSYLDTYENTEVKIKARIKDITKYLFYTQLDLKVMEIDGEEINHNLNLDLYVYETVNAAVDDIMEAEVILRATEPGDAIYNKSNGYYISADHVVPEIVGNEDEYEYGNEEESFFETFESNIKIIPAETHSIAFYVGNLQNSVRDIFVKNIRVKNSGNILQTTITQEIALVYAMFTGRGNYIDPRVRTNFNRTGIAHIVTVSGLNLSIIVGIIFSFLNMFKLHKKFVCVFIIIFCLFFMAFTGFSISIVRAGIMAILFYLSFLLSRKNDSVTSLFFAGAVICLITPYNVVNVSFQLSFLATLGIVLTGRINTKILSKIPVISLLDPDKEVGQGGFNKLIFGAHEFLQAIIYSFGVSLVSSILVTAAATIFTLPVTAYTFKTLSLISPLINLLVSPFISLMLTFALLLVVFCFIPPVLFVFGELLHFFSKIILNIVTFGASFKYSCISISSTSHDWFLNLSVILLVLIVTFFIVYSNKNKNKKAINIIFTALISLCVISMGVNLIYARYIFKDSFRAAYHSNYDNQSVILFHDDYEKADIIDITYGYTREINELRHIITDNGATNIGSVVFTHYHKRHVQLLEKFLNYCTIDKVFVPEPKTDYDREVFTALFDVVVNDDNTYRKSYELFIYYDGVVDLNDTTVIVNEFNYNSMKHMTVDIRRNDRKFLYLGIGYGEIYNYIGDTYDVVFYGTHKHNRKDDDYSTNIYGTHYGVLSDYLNTFKNKSTQRLEQDALEAYDFEKGQQLILSGNAEEFYPIFEVTKDDDLIYHQRKKSRK